jgi:hypothetical protein
MYNTRQPEGEGDYLSNPSNIFLSPKKYAALLVVLEYRSHREKIDVCTHV